MLTFINPEFINWLPGLVFFSAAWPQIIKNFRSKSAAAISQYMLLLALIGSVSKLIYNYCLGLPAATLIMRPLIMGNIITMVLQGFFYTRDKQLRKRIILMHSVLALVAVLFFIAGTYRPLVIGNFLGWLSMTVLAVYQVPQVMKNWQRKSVEGISFLYITLLAGGALLEMVATVLFGLPVQSFYNGLRGIGYYLIFCGQFWAYRKPGTTKGK